MIGDKLPGPGDIDLNQSMNIVPAAAQVSSIDLETSHDWDGLYVISASFLLLTHSNLAVNYAQVTLGFDIGTSWVTAGD